MWSLSSEEQKQQLGNNETTELNANNHKKKKEELEECNCASVQEKAANSGLVCDKCENQQQKFKNNSTKEDKLKFNIGKEIEEEEAIDSGFMSGLNPSSELAFEEEEEEKDKSEDPFLPDPQQKSLDTQNKEQQYSTTNLDSGFITEADNVVASSVAKTNVATKTSSSAAQVQNELQSNSVGTSAAKTRKTSSDNIKTVDEMRFKNNVDNGISERFCTLSLQTGGAGINNLNSTQRRSSSSSTVTQSSPAIQQERQKTRIAGWEEFYQQNSEGDTPLHLACLAGAEDVVIALLRLAIHPCLYNIQNDDAQTPLHMAALCTHAKILRLLLIMGAEPTIRDRHGNTALHVAVESGNEQCVRALLTPLSAAEIKEGFMICLPKFNDKKLLQTWKRNRMDLEIRNYNGERCVHLAAQEGRINILRMLVQCGADINAREGKSGRTPLHIAIEGCNEALLNFLLEECQKNLNLETETYAGLTAYQFACLLDKAQLTHMLEKSGAEPLTPPMSDYENSDGEDLDDSKVYGDSNFFAGYSGRKVLSVV